MTSIGDELLAAFQADDVEWFLSVRDRLVVDGARLTAQNAELLGAIRGALDAIEEGPLSRAERILTRALAASSAPTNKFSEGDPAVVLPADSRAKSQSESNGPSGSPTSPSERVSVPSELDTLRAENERLNRLVAVAASGMEAKDLDAIAEAFRPEPGELDTLREALRRAERERDEAIEQYALYSDLSHDEAKQNVAILASYITPEGRARAAAEGEALRAASPGQERERVQSEWASRESDYLAGHANLFCPHCGRGLTSGKCHYTNDHPDGRVFVRAASPPIVQEASCPSVESLQRREGYRGVCSATGARQAEDVEPSPSPNDPGGNTSLRAASPGPEAPRKPTTASWCNKMVFTGEKTVPCCAPKGHDGSCQAARLEQGGNLDVFSVPASTEEPT